MAPARIHCYDAPDRRLAVVGKIDRGARVYVAGHRGLVGSALVRRLEAAGFSNLLTRSRSELDLTDARATDSYFEREVPEYVFLAAAKVGGILANSTFPADFLRINLQIQTNVLAAAHHTEVKKLLFLGSSCIYPKLAPQPMKEEYLLTGALEPTNAPYAIAKIAGLCLCDSYNRQERTCFIGAMPPNLYGPGDNFDLQTSHVLPALIRKFHEAKRDGRSQVTLWGNGEPLREFLYVDDVADACLFLMENFVPDEKSMFLNVGCGDEISIRDLAQRVVEIVGYEGEIVWDTSKPNGTPRKVLDTGALSRLGWRPEISLNAGLRMTYDWYCKQFAQ